MSEPPPQNYGVVTPIEIIQHIYLYLAPKDFNAARHASSNWMKASLDVDLLSIMLRRGGWWIGHQAGVSDRISRGTNTSRAWLLSCRLARECALGSDWTGNGLGNMTTTGNGRPQPEVLVQTCRVDFSDLASGIVSKSACGGLVMTVSVCSRFLLVANGLTIYVYELIRDRIALWTVVVCPGRVLAMAMDATAHRYDVAILLDDRKGLVARLQGPTRPSAFAKSTRNSRSIDTDPSESTLEANQRSARDASVLATRLVPCDPGYIRPEAFNTRCDAPSPIITDVRTTVYSDILTQTPERPFTARWDAPAPVPADLQPSTIIIGPDSQHTYHHLCTKDDPPRSVAICPQRQCVAFGSGAGLELHWIDALTGQDLNRWFPLTGPSDYLYFLPPRRGVDTARTLRLMSSAAHPYHRPAVGSRFRSANAGQRDDVATEAEREAPDLVQTPGPSSIHELSGQVVMPRVSLFTGRGPGPRIGSSFIADTDHYRAVPLSDGFHLLFLDPEEGGLYIGTDAPLGSPQRLTRKIKLTTPADNPPMVPLVFAATSTLMTEPSLASIKVVAAYGDQLVLYSIPGNILESSREEGVPIPGGGPMIGPTTPSHLEWLDW